MGLYNPEPADEFVRVLVRLLPAGSVSQAEERRLAELLHAAVTVEVKRLAGAITGM